MGPLSLLVVLVATQMSSAQVREEDQGGTMRKTMDDLNKLSNEGRPCPILQIAKLLANCSY